MKNIKSYTEYNEEISIKGAEPTEVNQTIHNEIPNDFKVESKILSFGTDMYITNDIKENFGKIEERILSLGKKSTRTNLNIIRIT